VLDNDWHVGLNNAGIVCVARNGGFSRSLNLRCLVRLAGTATLYGVLRGSLWRVADKCMFQILHPEVDVAICSRIFR
jgi:hypothetical protein